MDDDEEEDNDLFHPSPIEHYSNSKKDHEDDDGLLFGRRGKKNAFTTPATKSKTNGNHTSTLISSNNWKSIPSATSTSTANQQQQRRLRLSNVSNASTTTILEEWRALRSTRANEPQIIHNSSSSNHHVIAAASGSNTRNKKIFSNVLVIPDQPATNMNNNNLNNISSVTMETDLHNLLSSSSLHDDPQQLLFYKEKCQQYELVDKPELLKKLSKERNDRNKISKEKANLFQQVQMLMEEIQSELLLPDDASNNNMYTANNSSVSIISELRKVKSHVIQALSQQARLETENSNSETRLNQTLAEIQQKTNEHKSLEKDVELTLTRKELLNKDVQELHSNIRGMQKRVKAESELLLKEAHTKARQIQEESLKKITEMEALQMADVHKRSARMIDEAFNDARNEMAAKHRRTQSQQADLENLRNELLDVQCSQLETEQTLNKFQKELEERCDALMKQEEELSQNCQELERNTIQLEGQELKMEQVSASLDSRLVELDNRELLLKQREQTFEKKSREVETILAAKRKEINNTTKKLEDQTEQLRVRFEKFEKECDALDEAKLLLAEERSMVEKENLNVETLRQRSREINEGEAQRILDCLSELEAHEETLREREESIALKENGIAATLNRLEVQTKELRQREEEAERTMHSIRESLSRKENLMVGKLEVLSTKLEAGKQALGNIENKRSMTEQQYNQLSKNLHTIQATIKENLEQSQGKVMKLEEQIRSKQLQLNDLNAQALEVSGRRTEVENSLKEEEDKLKASVAQWEAQLSSVREEVKRYQKDLKVSSEKLSQSQKAFQSVEQQIQKEKREWEVSAIALKHKLEQSINAKKETLVADTNNIRAKTRRDIQDLMHRAMNDFQSSARELETKTSRVEAQHEKLKMVVIQMNQERKSFDQRKGLFTQEQQNFNRSQEYQRMKMEQDRKRISQLEQQIFELEDQLVDEREAFRVEKEQAYEKLESNVTTVRQKLVEEVDSLREKLIQVRSEYEESEAAHHDETERFRTEIEALKRKFNGEQEKLRCELQSLKEEVSFEQQRHKNSLSTISALRQRIDKMQQGLDHKDILIASEKQSFETNRQLMNEKLKHTAAAACECLISNKKKHSMYRAFNLWHRALIEHKLHQKHEHDDHELREKSNSIEKLRLETQRTQERTDMRLKNWESSLDKREKEQSDRESLLLESRRALGEEWNALGRAMDDTERKNQDLQTKELELTKRESQIVQGAKRNEVSRIQNEELAKRLDAERRNFNQTVAQHEEQKTLSAYEGRKQCFNREAELEAREVLLKAKEDKFGEASLLLHASTEDQHVKRHEIDEKEKYLKSHELDMACKHEEEARGLSERRTKLEMAFQQVDAQRTMLINEKSLIEKQLNDVRAEKTKLDQEKTRLSRQADELASRARSLDDKETLLREKEEKQRWSQDTMHGIQTEKSQLEVFRKMLTDSKEELGRQRQTLMAELDSREDRLKEKEETLNEASKSLQSLIEAQCMKDHEIEERSEYLKSRELNLLSKRESDAKALSDGKNSLEMARRDVDLQRAALEEDKSRIEKQSKKLLDDRNNLDREKAQLSRQADQLTLRERTLDDKDTQLNEKEEDQNRSHSTSLREIQSQKAQLEVTLKMLMDSEKELEEEMSCIERQSGELRAERTKMEEEKSLLARQAEESTLRSHSLDSKEVLLREKKEAQQEVTQKVLIESANEIHRAAELQAREEALRAKEEEFAEASKLLEASIEEQRIRRYALAEKEKYLESKTLRFHAKQDGDVKEALERKDALQSTLEQIDLQQTELEQEKSRIERQSNELWAEKRLLEQEKVRLSRQEYELAARARNLDEMEALLRKEKEKEHRRPQGALNEIQSQRTQLDVTRKMLRDSEEELLLQQQSLAINSKDARSAQVRIKQLALQLKEKDDELRRDREALDQRLKKCDECEGFLSAWQQQLDKTSAALQARERELISNEEML